MLLAAGGTGGHLFPAEALADALRARGVAVDLATDERATRYGKEFPARQIHVIPSETRARAQSAGARAHRARIWASALLARLAPARPLRPAAVVGFGGYPTVPPLLAATLRRIPTIIHEQNAVMGRANRLLAPRVTRDRDRLPGRARRAPALAAQGARSPAIRCARR